MILTIPLIIASGILAWVLRPGKTPGKPRTIAILAAAIPPFTAYFIAAVFQILHNAAGKSGVSDIPNTCFLVGIGLVCAAVLAAIGFAVAHKKEIAKGIGFGVCIGAIISIIMFGVLEWLAGL